MNKVKREKDRPFEDKRILRVVERLQGNVVHAWLVKGSTTYKEWHGGPTPDWLHDICDTSPDMDVIR